MTEHASHSDWIIHRAVTIDASSAGFCGAFFRASAERRQVIAAYLSACIPSDQRWPETAVFLLQAGHDDILSRAFSTRPEGLRGSLRRAGPIVHEERFYKVLYRLLAQPRHTEVRNAIARLDRIDLTRLRIINVLPAEVCRTNVVLALATVPAAADLVTAMETLTEAGADRDALFAAIRNVRDHKMLRRVIGRTLLKCRAPAHPVPTSEFYRPIRTGEELHKLAARYRNCAKGYTISLLDEEAGQAFAEMNHAGESAVAHLRRDGGQWRLEGLFAPMNRKPSDALHQRATSYLAEHGVSIRGRGRGSSAWDSVRRTSATPLFEME